MYSSARSPSMFSVLLTSRERKLGQWPSSRRESVIRRVPATLSISRHGKRWMPDRLAT